MKANINKKNWVVRMECVVLKDVYVDNCTKEEAWANPFTHSTDGVEVYQRDWKVRSVMPARERKQFWAVDGTRVIKTTGYACPPNENMWWCPKLGWSGKEGYQLFNTKAEAQDAAIRELKEEIAACQPSTPARASRQKTLAKLKQERAKIK